MKTARGTTSGATNSRVPTDTLHGHPPSYSPVTRRSLTKEPSTEARLTTSNYIRHFSERSEQNQETISRTSYTSTSSKQRTQNQETLKRSRNTSTYRRRNRKLQNPKQQPSNPGTRTVKTTSRTRRITKIANPKNHANETSARCLPHILNDPQSGSNQTNQHSHPRNPHDLTTPPSLAALLLRRT